MRFFWLILLLVSYAANACDVLDDQGHFIKLTQPATRIISLAPDLTELLFAAGAGQHVIGVGKGSDYPRAAKNIPLVADFNHADIEKILALHPDLIVAWADSSLPEQVKKMGIPVYVSQQKHLTDIPRTLQRLGCLAGTSSIANQAAENFTHHYDSLKQHYAAQPKIPVFFQLWPTPLITVTQASWINEVIDLCGGKNIFADLHGVAPEVSVEAVLSRNPAVIIATDDQMNWRAAWRPWTQLAAVKQHHLFSIDADNIERASPRVLLAAEELCHHLAFTSLNTTNNAVYLKQNLLKL